MPDTYIYNIQDTWNDSETAYNAIQVNVTDTNSDPSSKLLNLKIDDSSKFSIGKDGLITFENGSAIGQGGYGTEQICSAQYRLRWENGRLWFLEQDGFTVRSVYEQFSEPGNLDDSTKGHVPGTVWRMTDNRIFICNTNSEEAAVWDEVVASQGPDGMDGSLWYVGQGQPEDGSANDLDLYLNTDNGDVYQQVSGTWNLSANIKGTDGIDGINGVVSGHIAIVLTADDMPISTGNAKFTFRMPYAMTLTEVRASLVTAPTGSSVIIDINQNGSSILSTELSIDANEKTSTTATVPAVISNSSLLDDAEIRIDIDQVGSSVAGTGLKLLLKGTV